MTTKKPENKLTPIFNQGPDFDMPPSNSDGWSDSEEEEDSDSDSDSEPDQESEESEESDKKDIESIDTELTILTRQHKGNKKITVLIGLDDKVDEKNLLRKLQGQLSCGGAIIDSEYNGIKQNVLQLNGDHITNKVQFDKMKNCITMSTKQKIKVMSY